MRKCFRAVARISCASVSLVRAHQHVDLTALYPAMISAVAVGACAGLHSGYASAQGFWRGYGILILGWSLFVLSRGLVAIFLLPFVLVEVVIGSFLPFVVVYLCFYWLGAAIVRRASIPATDKIAMTDKSNDSSRKTP